MAESTSPGTSITRSLKTITTEIKDRSREINSTKSSADALREALKVSPGNLTLTRNYYSAISKQRQETEKKISLINEARDKIRSKNQGSNDYLGSSEWKKLNNELTKAKANLRTLKAQDPMGQILSLKNLQDYFGEFMSRLKQVFGYRKQAITSFAESSEAIYASAKKYSQSAESFQLLANAYERVTGDANAYTAVMDSTIALQGRISTGNQKVITDLSHLGLTLSDLRGKGTDEVLSIITERRRELGETADVSSIAVALFGTNAGTYVTEMAKTSTEAVSLMNQELQKSGRLTDEQVANGKKTADSIALLKKQLQSLVAVMGDSLSPLVDSLSNRLKGLTPIIKLVAGALNAIGPAGTVAITIFLSMRSLLPKLIAQMIALNVSTGQWGKAISTLAVVGASLGAFGGIGVSLAQLGGKLTSMNSYSNELASGVSSSYSYNTTTSNNSTKTYIDNSVNNYNISKEVDADAVIEEITNKKRTIGG